MTGAGAAAETGVDDDDGVEEEEDADIDSGRVVAVVKKGELTSSSVFSKEFEVAAEATSGRSVGGFERRGTGLGLAAGADVVVVVVVVVVEVADVAGAGEEAALLTGIENETEAGVEEEDEEDAVMGAG